MIDVHGYPVVRDAVPVLLPKGDFARVEIGCVETAQWFEVTIAPVEGAHEWFELLHGSFTGRLGSAG
jgi:hypothetical protein